MKQELADYLNAQTDKLKEEQRKQRAAPKFICISAKCSDMFGATAYDENDNQVGESYDGYVPDFMPGEHFGDYVELTIELATGRIVNWKKPSQKALAETFSIKKV